MISFACVFNSKLDSTWLIADSLPTASCASAAVLCARLACSSRAPTLSRSRMTSMTVPGSALSTT